MTRIAIAIFIAVASIIAIPATRGSSSMTGTSASDQTTLRPPPGSLVVTTVLNGFASAPLSGIAISPDGFVYVSNDHQIYRFYESSLSSTSLTSPSVWVGNSNAGYQNGYGNAAKFSSIRGLAIDDAANLLVADGGNARLRIVTFSSLLVGDLCGSGQKGRSDGVSFKASFGSITGLTVDTHAGVFIADQSNGVVRRFTRSQNSVSTFLSLAGVKHVAVAPNGDIFFARDNAILLSTAGTAYAIVIAGSSVNIAGYRDTTGTDVLFNNIGGIAVSRRGDLYISDSNNHCIRVLDALSWSVKTVAGKCEEPGGANGYSDVSRWRSPASLAFSASGDLYVTEGGDSSTRLRKIAFY